jgi:outer membrane scaffolding protein for murein synthesis (MipA/OmpV family)
MLLLTATGTVRATDQDNEAEGAEQPLWELGFGGWLLDVPDYPGADQHRIRVLPLPYVVYRGDILRIGDDRSVRAVAAEGERFELSLSFDAAFDASSDKNRAREGMDDLDYLFEAGPQWRYRALEFDSELHGRGELHLSLQARAVLSTDLNSLAHRGYVAEPMLRYRHYGLVFDALDLNVALRPVWANREVQGYFYDVPEADARPDRPAYIAESGYYGTHLDFSATWHLNDRLRLFGSLQTLWQDGNVNRDSPLFRDSPSIGVGVGFTWSVLESERTVSRQ